MRGMWGAKSVQIHGNMKNEKIFWSMLLLLVTVIISYPLFSASLIATEDLVFHLNRIEGIKAGLMAGQFPVRIHAYQLGGYGYPVGIFYPDLWLYLPAILRLLGMPLVITYQLFCFLLHFATAFLAWYAFTILSRSLRVGGMAAVLYTGFWYRLLDFYERGAMGEMLAMVFLPLALAGTVELIRGNYKKYWMLAVLAYTGIMQSHILSMLLAGGAAILYCLWHWHCLLEPGRRRAIGRVLLFWLLLNLWFIVPFLTFYTGMEFNIKVNPQSSAGSAWSVSQAIAFFVGFGGAICLAMYSFLRTCWKKYRKFYRTENVIVLPELFLVSMIFVVLSTSIFPWEILGKIHFWHQAELYLQFPWRFMELSAVGLAYCGAWGIAEFCNRSGHRLMLVFGISVIFSLLSIMPIQQSIIPWRGYTVFDETKKLSSYGKALGGHMADYLYDDISVEELQGNSIEMHMPCSITNMQRKGTKVSFSYTCSENKKICLPMLYYAGYTVSETTGKNIGRLYNEVEQLIKK